MSVQLIKIEEKFMLGPKLEMPLPTFANCWIAGGAIRRWFTGKEELSDVDVFFENDLAFHDYCIRLKGLRYEEIGSHMNAVTFEGEAKIQCIRARFYPTLEVVFDSFDYTVCQFGWDGKDFFTTPHAIMSVLRNHLGVHNISKEYAVDSLRRAFKYHNKGFKPCNGTLQAIASSLSGLTQEQIKNAIEISPGGGLRTVRID